MDRIIVRLQECPQNLLQTSTEFSQNKGTVIDIGPSVCGVQKGDVIIFHAFDELPLPIKNLVVVREKSVLGIINDNHHTN